MNVYAVLMVFIQDSAASHILTNHTYELKLIPTDLLYRCPRTSAQS